MFTDGSLLATCLESLPMALSFAADTHASAVSSVSKHCMLARHSRRSYCHSRHATHVNKIACPATKPQSFDPPMHNSWEPLFQVVSDNLV